MAVVLPCYNAKRFVTGALESIKNQSFRNFEVIVVDDGSTDGSWRLLQRLARGDERIRLLRQDNQGLVESLRRGINATDAPFIARMDADDCAYPRRLEVQYALMSTSADIVACGTRARWIDPAGWPVGEFPCLLEHEEIDAALLRGVTPICHPSAMMRRDAYEQVGGYRREFEATQDYDLWLRLGEVGRMANVPEVLLDYRLHHQSLMVEPGRMERKRAQKRSALEDACRRRGITCSAISFVGRPEDVYAQKLWWAETALRAGYRRTAIKHAARCIAMHLTRAAGWKQLVRAIGLKRSIIRSVWCSQPGACSGSEQRGQA